MSDIEGKIKSLNIKLPEPKAPVGAYVATKIVGNYYISLVKYLLMKMQNL